MDIESVYCADHDVEAHEIIQLLGEHKIKSFAKHSAPVSYNKYSLPADSTREDVYVNREQAEEARKIILEYRKQKKQAEMEKSGITAKVSSILLRVVILIGLVVVLVGFFVSILSSVF